LRKFLHRDELAALIAVKAPAHERLALDLFLDTGVRVSELVSANVSDLWLDDGERVQLSVSVKGRGRRAEKFPVSLILRSPAGSSSRWGPGGPRRTRRSWSMPPATALRDRACPSSSRAWLGVRGSRG